jgi:hypothetical protein
MMIIIYQFVIFVWFFSAILLFLFFPCSLTGMGSTTTEDSAEECFSNEMRVKREREM